MLENIVICPVCQTEQKRVEISENEEARCIACNALLYKKFFHLEHSVLALSIGALVLFLLANLFPLISINLGGFQSSITLLGAIMRLFDGGYIFIALFCSLVLIIFPLLLMLFFALFALLYIFHDDRSKYFLTLATLLEKWSMLDIFFVAILVAMVKIVQYADIAFGLSFWAMMGFLAIDIYLNRFLRIQWLWDMWERRFALS